jgi:flagellar motor switch/type III secretory pathway protein FliN
MATSNQIPFPEDGQPSALEAARAAELAAEQALVPLVPDPETVEGMQLNAVQARLPVELDVAVTVRDFRVRNLLALEPGQIVETDWGHGEDVPLAAGEVLLAWSEFEVVDTDLAVRLTRLA